MENQVEKDLEAELEKAKKIYESKFIPQKIADNVELVYLKNEDGNISAQLRKTGEIDK